MSKGNASGNSQRTIVREMLFAQLAFAAFVGLIALGCVWWVSNWVVRDNLNDWATRWIGEMESLGSGFYLRQNDERFLDIEKYLARYTEIVYVRYYDANGAVIYVEHEADTRPIYPVLTSPELVALRDARPDADPYRLDESYEPLVRISQAVSTEAIVSIDLFMAQSLDELQTETSVVGFIELGLDYGRYDQNLFGSIALGSAFVVVAFLVLTLVGQIALRRVVQPLVSMQAPLEKMAEGELEVDVPTSPYREITAIGRALEAAASSIRERDKHLRRLANYDALTGLPNRHHLIDLLNIRMGELVHASQPGAVLFIDLDQFKYVNDSFGHQAGDAVLKQIAERLRQLVREQDLIARYSGDEFIIYVSHVSPERADDIARQLIQELHEYPLSYEGQRFNISCSVGITVASAPPIFTPEELISQADVACRQAKALGRNRTSHFSADQSELASIRSDLDWHQRLELALQNDDFELHFQPIMGLLHDDIRHYEVLVRVRDGSELFYPDAFLPAAVRFGLMQRIDHWVIAHALQQLADVRRTRPEICFSINITGSSFVDGTLATYISEQLDTYDLPASSIVLEITEQVAVGTFSDAVPQIMELIQQGCEFAVDDFGTGYSSLSYLKRLPVQYIKIDGAFIQRITSNDVDQAIVRAVAEIARIMGKRTVAEFVGDEATLKLIRKLGIDYAQGFHIGKPGPLPFTTTATSDRVVPFRQRNVG